MKHGITVLEMRGFAAMSTALARDMDRVALTPERVRAGAIRIVNAALDACRAIVPVVRAVHIGGDSWFIETTGLDQAIKFGILLLRAFETRSTQGLYYLKPSLATGCGEPRLFEGKFLDDASIETYRAADAGKPFRYQLTGEAVPLSKQYAWIACSTEPMDGGDKQDIHVVDWRNSHLPDCPAEPEVTGIALPKLLLDSEVLYSRSPAEALVSIQQQQASASNVYAFGGPVPLGTPMYRAYLKNSVALVREEGGPVFSVLSYIPMNEPETSFAWLELCRRLAIKYDTKFSFRAFAIPEGQLRPFSFQIFDDHTVHLGLRSYSPQKGTPTMSSAVMFRNTEVATRFKGEYIENWRSLRGFDETTFMLLNKGLVALSPAARKGCMKDVDDLLKDVEDG